MQLLVIASLSPLSPMGPSSYHGVVLLAMRSGWRIRCWQRYGRAAETRSSLKSCGWMCCAACLFVKYADKVNWVHDPASLTGQSIGRGRDERYSGREGEIFEGVDNSTSQEEGRMSGERCSRRCRRGVTDQSGPRADLGADLLPSVSSCLRRSRVACSCLVCAGAGAGLEQRKLPGLASGLRIGALLVLAVLVSLCSC
jgi:hypothetical protein